MKFNGYIMPPVVAGLLLTSCATQKDSPCLNLDLKNQKLTVQVSTDSPECEKVSYTKDQEGKIERTKLKLDFHPSNNYLTELILFSDGKEYKSLTLEEKSKGLTTDFELQLEPGFHRLEVLACDHEKLCSHRTIPIFSYNHDIVLASIVTNDKIPPRINEGNFYVGRTEIKCSNCSAYDNDSGIRELSITQGEQSLAKVQFETLEYRVSLKELIQETKINPLKPFTITAWDNNNNPSEPLEVSFDGYVSYAVGGP
jgi:hypothetical protein